MSPACHTYIVRLKQKLFLVFILLLPVCSLQAQISSFNFRHLTSAEGLSDGVIRTIAQDKLGFIWIGTSYGLNRFDGISVKTFFSGTGDSGSLSNNYIQSLYLDKTGKLWVGTFRDLCRFDDTTNRFVRYKSPMPLFIRDIIEDKKGRIWAATDNGLWIVDESQKILRKFSAPGDAANQKKFNFSIYQIVSDRQGTWYLATNQGIKIFDPFNYTISEIRHDPSNKSSLSGDMVYTISLDSLGRLWAACINDGSILNRIDLKDHSVRQYNHFIDPGKKWSTNTIHDILTDRNGMVWVASSYSGISLFDPAKDDFEDHLSDPLISNSIISNANVSMFQDRDGIIWLGSPGYGLSYFNPAKELFNWILPYFGDNKLVTETWCRSACEDRQGNLWLATGKGLAKYDRVKKTFRIFSNTDEKKPMLHFNSVRALLEDDNGDIWIGTSKGLNRYHPSTGIMDFFTEKQGIPLAFFWMIVKDKKGRVWLGSASGLYLYDREHDHFNDLSNDPLLSKYAHQNIQSLFVDSHDRLWVGILDVGLLMVNLANQELRLLTVKDSLISDTRFSSLAEDHDGLIWIGAEEKLTAYDPLKNQSRFFTREDGLTSDRTNNIMVDSLNRIWIGTSNGLCLLNAKRDYIEKFEISDGLLTNQFNEQAAYKTRDGLFIFPTYKGFLIFKPEAYKENDSPAEIYLTSFRILGKEIGRPAENLDEVRLRHDQNFFDIEMAGLNYMNPKSCEYAYKLEPFNKAWIITKERGISFTNVPPGRYVFRYKTIIPGNEKSAPEKTVIITISQVYYNTWWFRLIGVVALAAVIIAFYRYRVGQREKIHSLQHKAQLLEKEKALVMYESLKQQLNPHFLFNSLTSLRSLIKTDAKLATGFLDGMSKVYRYVLKSGEQELMPLQDELDFVRTFVELQKTRFKEGLAVNIHVEESSLYRQVVPATLQHLVENAIKHNMADRESPLVIDIFTRNDYVVVRNNLQRYRIVETSNKQGLANLQSLYRFYSNLPVQIGEDEKYFTVQIPLL